MFDPAVWAKVPFHFWSAAIFWLGCMVGSFLNVCIHRMPIGQSIVSPPSHCPHCKYSIPFWLNVPLVTWLMLRGKCANCRAPISIRYFLVELLTGLLFFGCWLRYGHDSKLVALVMCLVMAGLVVATFIDLAHFIIPDEITIGGAIVGFLCSFAVPALHATPALHGTPTASQSLRASFIGIVVGGALVEAVRQLGKLAFGRINVALEAETKIFFGETGVVFPDREVPYEEIFYRKSDAIRFHAARVELADRCYTNVDVALSPMKLKIAGEQFDPEQNLYMEAVTDKLVLPREAMGFGDVKFMAAIGAFLGWQATVFSLVVSSFLGAMVGGMLILLKRHERANPIPYGPYIAAAALLWIFAGQPLVDWFWARIGGGI
jgi:leader peptidase (prepilin peptidase)/N-methyltransferase